MAETTKPIAMLLSAAAFAAVTSLAADAGAQQPAAPAPSATTTAGYTERNVDGNQVVKFTGDELDGPSGRHYGTLIVRPPGVTRVGLIRPRMNFVSELLKSVENL